MVMDNRYPFELRSHPALGENVANGWIKKCPFFIYTPVTIIDADLTPILITPVTTTTKIPLKVKQVTALKNLTGTTTIIIPPVNTPITTVTAVQGTTTPGSATGESAVHTAGCRAGQPSSGGIALRFFIVQLFNIRVRPDQLCRHRQHGYRQHRLPLSHHDSGRGLDLH